MPGPLLIQFATRFLMDTPALRRLGRFLPQRLRRLVSSIFARVSEGADSRIRRVAERVRSRLLASNRYETAAWQRIRTRAEWEEFRDVRLDALRRSLGEFPSTPRSMSVRTTRTRSCIGFDIENLLFESRPGLLVTANLYRPAELSAPMPGILICHSHHNPKSQNELQDMGATWARCGCTVLIMDQLCHGERRQHPFRSESDYQGRFRLNRQDYFFRYNVGMQLHLIGDSLIGWMVWDLMRGVDVLLGRPGVDPERVVLIGSVAGGGDTAAVTAALDRRIAAVVPFGFGKARSETGGSGVEFNYVGGGSWESTRNLRLSARDGFAPWVILGAVAGRRLIYAHEFAWDPESDPVWKRLVQIYDLYGVPDHLAAIHGSGSVAGHCAGDTHCNNVGPIHRSQIYPVLERWFGMPVPVEEARVRHPEGELLCIAPEFSSDLNARPVHQLAADLGADRIAAARSRLAELDPAVRRETMQHELVRLLGDVQPVVEPSVTTWTKDGAKDVCSERMILEVEPGIIVPTILLLPARKSTAAAPVAIGFAQEGHRRLLRGRANLIGRLLRSGVAVCLPELRGTGDPGRGDEFRGRTSLATTASSGDLMLGRTLLGARLRDLRSVLRYLRTRSELDTARVGLWGDSFAPPNPPGQDLAVPFEAEPFPALCEPLGGLIALLGGLFEDDVHAVYLRGGLLGYASLLESRFCYVPHDVIVPGLLQVADLCGVAAALAPCPLRMEALVDGLNRRVAADVLSTTFRPARAAYTAAGAPGQLRLAVEPGRSKETARWILDGLRLK